MPEVSTHTREHGPDSQKMREDDGTSADELCFVGNRIALVHIAESIS